MAELAVDYMGMTLRNTIIVGSSGLTEKLDSIINLERLGAGAVVLKSLFEEEIILEKEAMLKQMQGGGFIYPETVEYYQYEDAPRCARGASLYVCRYGENEIESGQKKGSPSRLTIPFLPQPAGAIKGIKNHTF